MISSQGLDYCRDLENFRPVLSISSTLNEAHAHYKEKKHIEVVNKRVTFKVP
jgi:hypothetical protein